jgi:hypothetical protein
MHDRASSNGRVLPVRVKVSTISERLVKPQFFVTPRSWPELRIRNAAARPRIVSGGESCPSQREFSQDFKYIACARIPEFESYQPSHAVVSLSRVVALIAEQFP